jgi:hypothetical protein
VAHISTSTTRAEKTPAEWLKFGSQVGEQANKWAGRGDIAAYVGPGAGEGMAAALFKPAIAEMEIDVDLAFPGIKPEHVDDFTKRTTHFDHPAVAGATLHEAMHAKHTRFDLRELSKEAKKRKSPYAVDLTMWFEETRIERLGMRKFPKNRAFLRACALKLSIRELPDPDTLAERGSLGLSQLLLLTAARVDAGVLDYDDVATTVDTIKDYFGEELYNKLRAIWWKAQRLRCDSDYQPLLKLADEWLELLKEEGHEPPPPPTMIMISMAGPGTEGEKGEGEKSEGGSPMSGMFQEIMDGLGEEAADTEIAAQAEAYGQEAQEAAEEAAAQRAAAAAESKEHAEEAAKVFSKSTGEGHGGGTRSRLVEKRAPKDKERAAAVHLAKLLEKARYRDRLVSTRTTVIPPGRLRGRAAVQAAANRAAGREVQVPMWKHKVRQMIEDPSLTIGLLVDISGSMHAAMNPMATSAWVLQEAVRRIQGTVAAVYYGDSVFPVLKPGQHQDQVHVYEAPDSTERFDRAFKAINGSLSLLNGKGARLLVIVSDCCYTGSEAAALRKWVKRCEDAGVAVIIYNPEESDMYIRENLKGVKSVEVVAGNFSAVEIATKIGNAAVRQLERLGNRA